MVVACGGGGCRRRNSRGSFLLPPSVLLLFVVFTLALPFKPSKTSPVPVTPHSQGFVDEGGGDIAANSAIAAIVAAQREPREILDLPHPGVDVVKDWEYSAQVISNSSYALACVQKVGNVAYDFRAFGGGYQVYDKNTSSTYRVNLCVQPKRCNGRNDTFVCKQQRLKKEYGVEAITESSLGAQALWSAAKTHDSGMILTVPYIDGDLGKAVHEASDAFDLLEAFAASQFSSSDLDTIEHAISVVRRTLTTRIPVMVTSFVCDISQTGNPAVSLGGICDPGEDGWWGILPTEKIAQNVSVAYCLNITHRCACPNARCAPPPLPRVYGTCPRLWEGYIHKNIPGIIVVLLLALVAKREDGPCVQLFGGRLNIPLPINFLSHRSSRFVFGCIFAAFSSVCLDDAGRVLLNTARTKLFGSHSVIESFGMMFKLATLFYPMAASHMCKNRLLGSFLGVLYSTLSTYVMGHVMACHVQNVFFPDGAVLLPTFCALVCLNAYFLLQFVGTLRKVVKVVASASRGYKNAKSEGLWKDVLNACEMSEEEDFSYYSLRVRQLLRKDGTKLQQQMSRERGCEGSTENGQGSSAAALLVPQQRIKPALKGPHLPLHTTVFLALRSSAWSSLHSLQRILACGRLCMGGKRPTRSEEEVLLTSSTSFFRYSPRILAMAMVAICLLIECLIIWIDACIAFAKTVRTLLSGTRCEPLGIMNSPVALVEEWADIPYLQSLISLVPGIELRFNFALPCKTTFIVEDAVYYSFMAAGVIAAIVHTIYLAHMLLCYKKHILRLCRGDRSFLPKKTEKLSASVAITDALKYGGFQIAYLLGGWLINTFLICLLCLFIAFAIVLPILDVYDDWFFEPWLLHQLNPLGVSATFFVAQLALVRFVFSVRKTYVIRFQRWFHNMDFFVFFLNLFVGVYSFIARFILTVATALLWMGRLDKPLLSRGYEMNDPGFRTYVGFLLLDYKYCNPTAMTFTHLLKRRAKSLEKQKKKFIRTYVKQRLEEAKNGMDGDDDVPMVEYNPPWSVRPPRSAQNEGAQATFLQTASMNGAFLFPEGVARRRESVDLSATADGKPGRSGFADPVDIDSVGSNGSVRQFEASVDEDSQMLSHLQGEGEEWYEGNSDADEDTAPLLSNKAGNASKMQELKDLLWNRGRSGSAASRRNRMRMRSNAKNMNHATGDSIESAGYGENDDVEDDEDDGDDFDDDEDEEEPLSPFFIQTLGAFQPSLDSTASTTFRDVHLSDSSVTATAMGPGIATSRFQRPSSASKAQHGRSQSMNDAALFSSRSLPHREQRPGKHARHVSTASAASFVRLLNAPLSFLMGGAVDADRRAAYAEEAERLWDSYREESLRKRRVRTRWLLLLTLVNNPQLRLLRKCARTGSNEESRPSHRRVQSQIINMEMQRGRRRQSARRASAQRHQDSDDVFSAQRTSATAKVDAESIVGAERTAVRPHTTQLLGPVPPTTNRSGGLKGLQQDDSFEHGEEMAASKNWQVKSTRAGRGSSSSRLKFPNWPPRNNLPLSNIRELAQSPSALSARSVATSAGFDVSIEDEKVVDAAVLSAVLDRDADADADADANADADADGSDFRTGSPLNLSSSALSYRHLLDRSRKLRRQRPLNGEATSEVQQQPVHPPSHAPSSLAVVDKGPSGPSPSRARAMEEIPHALFAIPKGFDVGARGYSEDDMLGDEEGREYDSTNISSNDDHGDYDSDRMSAVSVSSVIIKDEDEAHELSMSQREAQLKLFSSRAMLAEASSEPAKKDGSAFPATSARRNWPLGALGGRFSLRSWRSDSGKSREDEKGVGSIREGNLGDLGDVGEGSSRNPPVASWGSPENVAISETNGANDDAGEKRASVDGGRVQANPVFGQEPAVLSPRLVRPTYSHLRRKRHSRTESFSPHTPLEPIMDGETKTSFSFDFPHSEGGRMHSSLLEEEERPDHRQHSGQGTVGSTTSRSTRHSRRPSTATASGHRRRLSQSSPRFAAPQTVTGQPEARGLPRSITPLANSTMDPILFRTLLARELSSLSDAQAQEKDPTNKE